MTTFNSDSFLNVLQPVTVLERGLLNGLLAMVALLRRDAEGEVAGHCRCFRRVVAGGQR